MLSVSMLIVVLYTLSVSKCNSFYCINWGSIINLHKQKLFLFGEQNLYCSLFNSAGHSNRDEKKSGGAAVCVEIVLNVKFVNYVLVQWMRRGEVKNIERTLTFCFFAFFCSVLRSVYFLIERTNI